MSYSVFRSDLMSGTDVAADLVSFKFYDGNNEAAIQNGHVVKLDGLLANERELYKAVAPEADTALDEVVIVGGVELQYDERKRNLDEYINEKGKAVRGYMLRPRNVFSVTKEGLTGKNNPVAGDIVELTAGTQLRAAASLTAGSTQVGTIIHVEQTNRYTYYVVRIGE